MTRRLKRPGGVFTVAMIADRWGTSETFVYDLIRAGELPAFRLGAKLWRIRPEDVEEFECRDSPGASDRSPDDVLTEHATAAGASNGQMIADRTASRLERLIERPRRPQLVTSGPDGPWPPSARSAKS